MITLGISCSLIITPMLKTEMYKALIRLIVFSTSLVVSGAFASEEAVFCTEARPYPPFIYLDESGEPKGTLVEIVKTSAKHAGIKPLFISESWLRCQKLVLANEAQALFGMIRTPERELKFQFPPEPQYIVAAQYPIFSPKDGLIHRNYKYIFTDNAFAPLMYRKIKQFGLQAPMGYVAQSYLEQHELTPGQKYTVDEGLKLAAINRLDGYIVERKIGLARLRTLGLESRMFVSEHAVLTDYWYVPFNKEYFQHNKPIVTKFWSQIAKTRAGF